MREKAIIILMDMVILEGICCGTSKFVQGYMSLCHYSYRISMLLCGRAWKMLSLTMCYTFYFQGMSVVWGNLKCMLTNGFINRSVYFLLKKEEINKNPL